MALDPADGEFVSAQEAREPTGGTNQFQDNLVPFMYNNGKEIKKISVPARWYWGSVVKRMITHNKAHGFTGAVLIGGQLQLLIFLNNQLFYPINFV